MKKSIGSKEIYAIVTGKCYKCNRKLEIVDSEIEYYEYVGEVMYETLKCEACEKFFYKSYKL